MCVGVYTHSTHTHIHTHTPLYTFFLIYIHIYLYLESQSSFHVLVLKGKKNKVPGWLICIKYPKNLVVKHPVHFFTDKCKVLKDFL